MKYETIRGAQYKGMDRCQRIRDENCSLAKMRPNNFFKVRLEIEPGGMRYTQLCTITS